MNPEITQEAKKISDIIIPLMTFLIIFGAGFILRRFLFSRLGLWAKKAKKHYAEVIISSAQGPFLIWWAMLALYLALRSTQLPWEALRISGKILFVLGIASGTMVLAHMATALVKQYGQKIESALLVTSLTQNIARVVIFIMGALVILNSLGVSITPLLAALGVGGLAVALALQDTLANFFAGFNIVISRQIKKGDYIRIENGDEGYVEDINWRTTQVRLLSNNLVLVPNAKLTQSIITNYYLPDKKVVFTLPFGVHYQSDLEKVDKIAIEVARQTLQEVPGGVKEFEPKLRYGALGDYGVQCLVFLQAEELTGQYLLKHEFIKRLHKRFAKEGVVIPYPVRAINYSQEKA